MRGGRRDNRPVTERPAILVLGAVTFAVGALLIFIAFRAPTGLPGEQFYDVTVQLEDLSNLPDLGAEVRIAGRRVGQTVNARSEGGQPTVDLQLDSDVEPLPADTAARVRLRSLIGAQYVELVPGSSSQSLPDGGTIPVERTSAAVQVFELLDTFDAPRRRALGQMLRGLGTGFAGRGAGVNDMIRHAPGVARDVSAVLDAVLAREDSVVRFVHAAESLTAALDPVRETMARGFADGADALAPFAAERRSMRRTLDVAPGALAGVRSGLARTDPVLARTTRFAEAASAFTAQAPRALDATAALLRGAREPLRDLRTIVQDTRVTIPPTLEAMNRLRPVLPGVRATLEVARQPARVLGAYGCDLRGMFSNWRSFLGFAPPGQDGPLGPQTVLRVVAASDADPAAPRGRREAYPPPCAVKGIEGEGR